MCLNVSVRVTPGKMPGLNPSNPGGSDTKKKMRKLSGRTERQLSRLAFSIKFFGHYGEGESQRDQSFVRRWGLFSCY